MIEYHSKEGLVWSILFAVVALVLLSGYFVIGNILLLLVAIMTFGLAGVNFVAYKTGYNYGDWISWLPEAWEREMWRK